VQAKNFAGVLLALVVLGRGVMAQTSTTAPNYQSVVTTGMVGIAASQTAQLNVLNITMAATIASLTAPACPVEMDFFDSQGRSVKSTSVSNLAPGAAASLTLKLSEFPTASPVALHTLVRGVVKTNPAASGTPTPGTTGSGTTGSGTTGPGTTAPTLPGGVVVLPPIYYAPGCSVFTTLEVFDSSGVTQTFTSDTRALESFVVPLFNRGN